MGGGTFDFDGTESWEKPWEEEQNDKPKSTTTKFIEVEMGFDDWGWDCEECGAEWVWDAHPEDHRVNYCPRCGREIVEFVSWKEDDEQGGVICQRKVLVSNLRNRLKVVVSTKRFSSLESEMSTFPPN